LLRLIVHVERVPASFSLYSYSHLIKAQYAKIFPAGTPLPEITNTQLAGRPACRALFSNSHMNLAGRFYHVWTVVDQRAFVLTFVHHPKNGENDPDRDLYQPIFNRVAASFALSAPGYQADPSLRYENLTQKFAIHFPNNYEVQEGFMGATCSFSEPGGESEHSFANNINIVVQDMSGQQMNLEEFTEMLKSQLDFSIQQYEMLDTSDCYIVGQKGRQFKYQGKIGSLTVKFIQKVVISGGKAVVLSFASEFPKFEREYARVGAYLESFQFIEV